jgi:ATP-dependent Clp protease ATP-binding subunit ClpC
MEDELHNARRSARRQAIKALSQAIRRTRAGLKDPKRPAGSFIFARPDRRRQDRAGQDAGRVPVRRRGRAHPARHVRVHGEAHGVASRSARPRATSGYEEGGQLTETVRRKPFSVVLFDEIEKAHPDVFNTLLQILEDGRLTDAQGRVGRLQEHRHHHDHEPRYRDICARAKPRLRRVTTRASDYERMKAEGARRTSRQHFRPEFLNRIDDTIVFHELTKHEVMADRRSLHRTSA